LQILSLKSVDSTQIYIKKLLREKSIKLPFAVTTTIQTNGIGSRNNSWIGLEGNLFLSFAISFKDLPNDLKLESSSIYFSYLLKEVLSELNSSVWLKWPNDFYLNKIKIGGMITNIVGDTLICGVGLNLITAPDKFLSLDIQISKEKLLKLFFLKIEKKIEWKQVFSKYQLEFHKNREFSTHKNSVKVSLKDAVLQNDGSIISDGERIYSLR